MMLLLAGCEPESLTAPAPVTKTSPDLHLAIAQGDKFSITLLETDEQKRKYPELQDQLNGKVIVDLPLIPGSTADDGPWKGGFGGVYNVFNKHDYKRYDAPLPLAQAKTWFQKEMTSEGYTTYNWGVAGTFWDYGKDPHLEVDIALLDKGNGHTLVEYGVTYSPIPKRPSSTLLTSVSKAEIKVTADKATQEKTITNPNDLQKLVALYNQLPLTGDDGNHPHPAPMHPVSAEVTFTESDGKTVQVNDDPYSFHSGVYYFFDKDEQFSKLAKTLVDGQ